MQSGFPRVTETVWIHIFCARISIKVFFGLFIPSFFYVLLHSVACMCFPIFLCRLHVTPASRKCLNLRKICLNPCFTLCPNGSLNLRELVSVFKICLNFIFFLSPPTHSCQHQLAPGACGWPESKVRSFFTESSIWSDLSLSNLSQALTFRH